MSESRNKYYIDGDEVSFAEYLCFLADVFREELEELEDVESDCGEFAQREADCLICGLIDELCDLFGVELEVAEGRFDDAHALVEGWVGELLDGVMDGSVSFI